MLENMKSSLVNPGQFKPGGTKAPQISKSLGTMPLDKKAIKLRAMSPAPVKPATNQPGKGAFYGPNFDSSFNDI